MANIDLSAKESAAIDGMLAHWIEKWNCESPTLFGLQLGEMRLIASDWRNVLRDDEESAAKALLSGMAEILYGASAVRKTKIESLLGITYDEAATLTKKLHAALHHAL
jgi:hypothetical protein